VRAVLLATGESPDALPELRRDANSLMKQLHDYQSGKRQEPPETSPAFKKKRGKSKE